MAIVNDPLDVAAIKKDFPILEREVHGGRLVYLDSANTSQKPRVVLDAMTRYYEHSNANVHRGTYLIAEEATAELEGARAKVARFIGADHPREVVFTKNAPGLNLNIGSGAFSTGDVAYRARAPRRIVPGTSSTTSPHRDPLIPDPDGHLDSSDLDRLPMAPVVRRRCPTSRHPRRRAARHRRTRPRLPWSMHRAMPHVVTDVQAWGDFAAFTGHKMSTPGIGVLGTARSSMPSKLQAAR
jgi:cysteine desulfurase/selenocysteine lyase